MIMKETSRDHERNKVTRPNENSSSNHLQVLCNSSWKNNSPPESRLSKESLAENANMIWP